MHPVMMLAGIQNPLPEAGPYWAILIVALTRPSMEVLLAGMEYPPPEHIITRLFGRQNLLVVLTHPSMEVLAGMEYPLPEHIITRFFWAAESTGCSYALHEGAGGAINPFARTLHSPLHCHAYRPSTTTGMVPPPHTSPPSSPTSPHTASPGGASIIFDGVRLPVLPTNGGAVSNGIRFPVLPTKGGAVSNGVRFPVLPTNGGACNYCDVSMPSAAESTASYIYSAT